MLERSAVESLGVEGSLTPVPIEKGRIANLSVGFVENDPLQPVVPSHSCRSQVQDLASGGHAEATARALPLPNAAQTQLEKLCSCCCLGQWISAAET